MTGEIPCPAESLGRCDDGRRIHECDLGDDHDGGHECACGWRWAERDE